MSDEPRSGDETLAYRHADERSSAATVPHEVGGYRIVGSIASGGMGTVYEAEQQSPKRTVALKVIRHGWTTPELLKRFALESQVLGRLHHPGIAQIYEAGTAETEHGPQPFFAMEYVQGVDLREHVHRNNLPARARLELIARICDAVHHAHQKGVIHRDLKPGNVLVDATGQPKILDFGVARVTDADLMVATRHTDVGQVIGTVPYMSPEQIAGDPRSLDTRSDVYALGVITYELLTGRRPYDLENKSLVEAARIIREEEPTAPSRAHRLLRGDIETVVGKALEKEPDRRYASAAELGDDIRRYLRDEPVLARPPSTLYQLQKFAKRNKAIVGGLGGAIAALVLGLMASTALFLRAEREAEAARRERDKTAEFADFMASTLEGVGPSVALGRDTEMLAELMDAAAARIDGGELRDVPGAELRLRLTIGGVYREIAQFEAAERMLAPVTELAVQVEAGDGDAGAEKARALAGQAKLLAALGRSSEALVKEEEALATWQRLYASDHVDVAESLGSVGLLKIGLGRAEEALPSFEEALAMLRRLSPADHPDVAAGLNNVGFCLQQMGRPVEALPYYEQSLEMRRRIYPRDHLDVALGLHNLASILDALDRSSEAIPLHDESLAIYRRLLPRDHPLLATGLNNIAFSLDAVGRSADALPRSEEALTMRRRLFHGDHPDVAVSLNTVAFCLQHLDRLSEALPLYEESLAMRRRLYAGDHPSVVTGLSNLANCLQRLGRAAEALPMFEEVVAMNERLYDGDHPALATGHGNLASCLQNLGRSAEALANRERQLAIFRRTLPDGHRRIVEAEIGKGSSLVALERYREAEELLTPVCEGIAQRDDLRSSTKVRCLDHLIALLEAMDEGHAEKAAEYRRIRDALSPPP